MRKSMTRNFRPLIVDDDQKWTETECETSPDEDEIGESFLLLHDLSEEVVIKCSTGQNAEK